MKNEQLEKSIISDLESALLSSDDPNSTVFVVPETFYEAGRTPVIQIPYFGTPLLKELVLNGIGFASHLTGEKAVYVAFDSWFREISKEQADYEIKEYGAVRTPHELPLDDRSHAITIVCVRFDGGASILTFKRYRMEKGERVLHGEVHRAEIKREESGMVNAIFDGFEEGVSRSQEAGA